MPLACVAAWTYSPTHTGIRLRPTERRHGHSHYSSHHFVRAAGSPHPSPNAIHRLWRARPHGLRDAELIFDSQVADRSDLTYFQHRASRLSRLSLQGGLLLSVR